MAPILLAALVSCGSEEDDPWVRREAETRKAFQLEAEADLVIYHESDERISLFPRGTREARRDASPFPADELERRLAAVETPKALCVVVMGKHTLPADVFRQKMDRLEDLLRSHGWSRVVVQLGLATGRRIYIE